MSNARFVYVSYIATTAGKLWEALTRGELTRQYWYGRRIESDWKVQSPVRFYDRDSEKVTDAGAVLECDPPRRLVYTFRPEFNDEVRKMGFSRVAFTIEGVDSMCKLTLVHDELKDQEMADGFQQGWAPILSSLKTFLETGRPLPEVQEFVEKGKGK